MEELNLNKQQQEIFTINSLAEYLGCSTQLVRKYIRESNIPCFKIGNKFFFRKSSVDRHLEKQESSFSEKREKDLKDIIRRLN